MVYKNQTSLSAAETNASIEPFDLKISLTIDAFIAPTSSRDMKNTVSIFFIMKFISAIAFSYLKSMEFLSPRSIWLASNYEQKSVVKPS